LNTSYFPLPLVRGSKGVQKEEASASFPFPSCEATPLGIRGVLRRSKGTPFPLGMEEVLLPTAWFFFLRPPLFAYFFLVTPLRVLPKRRKQDKGRGSSNRTGGLKPLKE